MKPSPKVDEFYIYLRGDGDDGDFPVPAVVGTIGSSTGIFVLDTGAAEVGLDAGIAWLFGSKSHGKHKRVSTAATTRHLFEVASGAIKAMNHEFTHHLLLKGGLYEMTNAWGVVSPSQLVRPERAVILDFPNHVGYTIDTVDLPSWAKQTAASRSADGLYHISVVVNGVEDDWLIDSGASSSTISSSSPIRRLLDPGGREEIVGAYGVYEAAKANAKVEVAGRSFEVVADVLQGSTEGYGSDTHGLLGFDVLRHCRVVLRFDGAQLDCDSRGITTARALPPVTNLWTDETTQIVGIQSQLGCGLDEELYSPTSTLLQTEYDSALDAYYTLDRQLRESRSDVLAGCTSAGYFDAFIEWPFLRRIGDELVGHFSVSEGRRRRVRSFEVEVSASGKRRSYDPEQLGFLDLPGRVFIPRRFLDGRARLHQALRRLKREFASPDATDFSLVGDDLIDVKLLLHIDGEEPPTIDEIGAAPK